MCSIYELIFITNLYCNYCTFVHRYVDDESKERKRTFFDEAAKLSDNRRVYVSSTNPCLGGEYCVYIFA